MSYSTIKKDESELFKNNNNGTYIMIPHNSDKYIYQDACSVFPKTGLCYNNSELTLINNENGMISDYQCNCSELDVGKSCQFMTSSYCSSYTSSGTCKVCRDNNQPISVNCSNLFSKIINMNIFSQYIDSYKYSKIVNSYFIIQPEDQPNLCINIDKNGKTLLKSLTMIEPANLFYRQQSNSTYTFKAGESELLKTSNGNNFYVEENFGKQYNLYTSSSPGKDGNVDTTYIPYQGNLKQVYSYGKLIDTSWSQYWILNNIFGSLSLLGIKSPKTGKTYYLSRIDNSSTNVMLLSCSQTEALYNSHCWWTRTPIYMNYKPLSNQYIYIQDPFTGNLLDFYSNNLITSNNPRLWSITSEGQLYSNGLYNKSSNTSSGEGKINNYIYICIYNDLSNKGNSIPTLFEHIGVSSSKEQTEFAPCTMSYLYSLDQDMSWFSSYKLPNSSNIN